MNKKLHLEVSRMLNYDNHLSDLNDLKASECYFHAFKVANQFNYENKNGGINCLFLPREDNINYFPFLLPLQDLEIILKEEYYVGGADTKIYYLDFSNKEIIKSYLISFINKIDNQINQEDSSLEPEDYYLRKEEIHLYEKMKQYLEYFYNRKMLLFFTF